MIFGQGNVSSTEDTAGIGDALIESAAQVVSDEEMAGIVKAASALRIEAHTAELVDLADVVDLVDAGDTD
jgi:hypothetical protein